MHIHLLTLWSEPPALEALSAELSGLREGVSRALAQEAHPTGWQNGLQVSTGELGPGTMEDTHKWIVHTREMCLSSLGWCYS